MLKIINIVGARPQFIKSWPIIKKIRAYNEKKNNPKIIDILLHTGQHYDFELSKIFFDELGIKTPDYHLGVGSGTHGYQTGEMIKGIESVLLEEKPDFVLVYGDTNSTLAGAIASAKLGITLGHVEAGLRSYNKKMPEEINRVLTDHISDLLFCPVESAVKNLKREGIVKGVYMTGDVMLDSIIMVEPLINKRAVTLLRKLDLESKKYILCTIHRAENTDSYDNLSNIFMALKTLVKHNQQVVLPIHPRTQKKLIEFKIKPDGIRLIKPLSYINMLALERNARLIITDSGGVQKEAYFLRVPCLTTRNETEWKETVLSGWNKIVGTNPKDIVEASFSYLPSKGEEKKIDFGNGNASGIILDLLIDYLKNKV